MLNDQRAIGAISLIVALLAGATVYAGFQTLFRVIPLVGRAPVGSLVLLGLWLMTAVLFMVLLGRFLYRMPLNDSPELGGLLFALWLALPVVNYRGDSFTVLPYVLNLNIDLGRLAVGVNGFAAVLLAMIWGMKRQRARRDQTEAAKSGGERSGAIESQSGGS